MGREGDILLVQMISIFFCCAERKGGGRGGQRPVIESRIAGRTFNSKFAIILGLAELKARMLSTGSRSFNP